MPKIHIYITKDDERPAWRSKETVVEMSEIQLRLFMQNSVERVINTSMRIAEESDHEYADVNYEDWEFLKPIVTYIFNAVRSALFYFPFKGRE